MNTTRDKIITIALTPLSWIYHGVTELRNKCFDWGILKQESFSVPVVCVGNITVGGTGKTPHVEYILANLQGSYRIGVISRGYKRRTKGFVLANTKSTPETIGDESYQMYHKFGKRVKIAVCEKRSRGIEQLLKIHPEINLIILDDAFQHRYVKPKVSVMLMDYSRQVNDDKVLPLGRLREDASGMNRAHIVVVTKCPDTLKPIDARIVIRHLNLLKFQRLFFSRIRYTELRPVFEHEARYTVRLESLTSADTVLLVTGIANPRSLIKHCRQFPFRTRVMYFEDHHDFSKKDLRKIEDKFNTLKGARKIILTTEKDGGRMLNNPYFPEELKPFCFAQPMQVEMIDIRHNGHDFINELVSDIDKMPPGHRYHSKDRDKGSAASDAAEKEDGASVEDDYDTDDIEDTEVDV